MRHIKFSILLQHEETGRTLERQYTYAELESGEAIRQIDRLTGYSVIARREYIGYKDKHGKDIYDGDILQDAFGVRQVAISFVDSYHVLSGWTLHLIRKPGDLLGGYETTHPSWLQNAEVVGNTYENPELLEQEQD